MSHRIVLPRIIEIGKGAQAQLVNVLKQLGVGKPLIVTDRTMVQLGYVAKLETLLKDGDVPYGIFADTIPEPTAASIEPGIAMVREGTYDSVVAFGGGSPIDSAKAIAVVGKLGGRIQDYKVPFAADTAGLPVIAIPTTAGTGSEATRMTVITDQETDEKMLCAGLGFLPVAALVDYSLTVSLPARVTADCGLDALTHALEAYVSRKANPFSDVQALAALRLIGPSLRNAFHRPDDENAREAMMLGAHLAGIAFSNASVALVHGMSRPIGAHFHVPHGLSNAMLLPAITRFSLSSAQKRYADAARAMQVADRNDTDAAACEKLVIELQALNKELQVPGLRQFGIDPSRFEDLVPLMAKQARASGSPANNPRSPDEAEMVALYQEIYASA